MYVAVCGGIVTHVGYPTILAGLPELGLTAVEMGMGREMNAGVLEPVDGQNHMILDSDAAIERYRSHFADNGIKLSAFILGNNFNLPDPKAEIAWVTRVVETAFALGIPAVRIDSAMTGETELSFAERVGKFVEALGTVIANTAKCPVDLGIENHGHQGNQPEFLNAIFEGVGSPRLGMTLDSGNFYWYGHPLDRVMQILHDLAPKAKHTHLKNISYPAELRNVQREVGWKYGEHVRPLDQGDVDHAKVVQFLREAGYDRDLCIEDESLGRQPAEQRKAVLRRDVEYIRSLI
jgi:sugar phosphate isomerase/epimerase